MIIYNNIKGNEPCSNSQIVVEEKDAVIKMISFDLSATDASPFPMLHVQYWTNNSDINVNGLDGAICKTILEEKNGLFRVGQTCYLKSMYFETIDHKSEDKMLGRFFIT